MIETRVIDGQLLRRCSRCGEMKPLDAFSKRKQSPDGLNHHCRKCRSQVWKTEYRHASTERNYEHVLALGRGYKRRSGYWKARNPEHERARAKLHYAVSTGRIVKPTVCEDCGKTALLHGHHEDYARPLDVRWLCSICHGLQHRKVPNAQRAS